MCTSTKAMNFLIWHGTYYGICTIALLWLLYCNTTNHVAGLACKLVTRATVNCVLSGLYDNASLKLHLDTIVVDIELELLQAFGFCMCTWLSMCK